MHCALTSTLTHLMRAQVQEVFRLPEALALRLLHCMSRHFSALLTKSQMPLRCSYLGRHPPGADLAPERLPLFLTVLPTALHPLALRAHSPAIDRDRRLHLPHLPLSHAATAIAAACSLPHLTSLLLCQNCTGCYLRSSGAASSAMLARKDIAAHIAVEFSRLAHCSALRSLAFHHATSEDDCGLMRADLDIGPFQTDEFCDIVLHNLPQLKHVTQLELIGFNFAKVTASPALPALASSLRSLHLGGRVPGSLGKRDTYGDPSIHPDQTRSCMGPYCPPARELSAVLTSLHALEQLDLSGCGISGKSWMEVVPTLSTFPLHSLNISNCSLVLSAALPLMWPSALERQQRPFARLTSLDISGNPMDTPHGSGRSCYDQMRQDTSRSPISTLLGQLTELQAANLTYRCKPSLDWFVKELERSNARAERCSIGVKRMRLKPWRGTPPAPREDASDSEPHARVRVRRCLAAMTRLRALQCEWADYLDAKRQPAPADLPNLRDLSVSHTCVGTGSAQLLTRRPLDLLTGLLLQSLEVSCHQASAFSSWLGSLTTLRVLRVHSMHAAVHPLSAVQLERVVACMGGLTQLVELRVCLEHPQEGCNPAVQALGEALPRLQRLTCLEFGLHGRSELRRPGRGQQATTHGAHGAPITKLQPSPGLNELWLHNIWLDWEADENGRDISDYALGVGSVMFEQMPRLRVVVLDQCILGESVERIRGGLPAGAALRVPSTRMYLGNCGLRGRRSLPLRV